MKVRTPMLALCSGALMTGVLMAGSLIGCSASTGPASYVYDTAQMSESSNLAKYDWYEIDQSAGTITVTLPAQTGYEYGNNVFNEDVMKVQSEQVEGDTYKVVLAKAGTGKTSLNFYGYTADTGRTDSTAVLEVDVSNNAITAYYTGNDFEYDPSRFDCIPIN